MLAEEPAPVDLLHLDVVDADGWTVLCLRGQLDVATAPRFRQALVEAQYGNASHVAVDLSAVEFLDSMGLGVLVGGLKRARSHDGELVLICPHGRIRQLLDLTRISEIARVLQRVDDLR